MGLRHGRLPPDLTGAWNLNVAKSKWGSVRKPINVVVFIEHREPSLNYHGSIVWGDDTSREFGFQGAIDGKQYPFRRSYGEGKIVLRRLDPYTIVSTFKTDDGVYVETINLTVSRDGRSMSRRMRVRTPDGERVWTEIYERK